MSSRLRLSGWRATTPSCPTGTPEYLGTDGDRVVSQPAHGVLSVREEDADDKFLDHLQRHERGETSYLEMSSGLAESGVDSR